MNWSGDGAHVILEGDLDTEDSDGHDLIVVGHGRITKAKHGPLVVPEPVIAPAAVSSLGAAARDPRRCCASIPDYIDVVTTPTDSFDEYLYDPDPVRLEIEREHVYALIEVLLTGERAEEPRYRDWLQPTAQTHGCHVASVRFTDESGEDDESWRLKVQSWPFPEDRDRVLAAHASRPRIIEVRVEPDEGATAVSRLLSAGRDVHALLNALHGGRFDVNSVGNVLRAGLPHLLVGLAESDWLEVKSRPYSFDAPDTAATKAKIEFAQDVASFANHDRAALLVIGLETKQDAGSDIVSKVNPAKTNSLQPSATAM